MIPADAIFAFALSVVLAAIIFARLSAVWVASAILASLPALLLGACQRVAICSELAGLAVVSFCIMQTFFAFACNSVAISRNSGFHISVAVAFLARSPVQRIAEKVGLALFAAIAGRTSWTVEARDVGGLSSAFGDELGLGTCGALGAWAFLAVRFGPVESISEETIGTHFTRRTFFRVEKSDKSQFFFQFSQLLKIDRTFVKKNFIVSFSLHNLAKFDG